MARTMQQGGVTRSRPILDFNANLQSALLAWKSDAPVAVIVPFMIPALVDLVIILTQWMIRDAQAPIDRVLITSCEQFSARLGELGYEASLQDLDLIEVTDRELFYALSTRHLDRPWALSRIAKVTKCVCGHEEEDHTMTTGSSTLYHHGDTCAGNRKVLIKDSRSNRVLGRVFSVHNRVIFPCKDAQHTHSRCV